MATTKVTKTPQPKPYSIAAGAIAYALAITFKVHLSPQVLAALPAVLTAAVATFETVVKGAEKADPSIAPEVAVASRLEAQAAQAVAEVEAAAS